MAQTIPKHRAKRCQKSRRTRPISGHPFGWFVHAIAVLVLSRACFSRVENQGTSRDRRQAPERRHQKVLAPKCMANSRAKSASATVVFVKKWFHTIFSPAAGHRINAPPENSWPARESVRDRFRSPRSLDWCIFSFRGCM